MSYANTGFRLNYGEHIQMSDLGPAVLTCFAFFLLIQGLIYLLRPDMSWRALTAPKEKIRRTGLYITLASGILLYLALSWWVSSWSQ
jgi:hypothetical protein